MPSSRISTGDWAIGRELLVIETVQEALSTALELPEWDQDIVLDCYGSRQRLIPVGRSELFTRVEISLFSGRSMDTKRRLYAAIVNHLGTVGVPPDEIKIVLIDVPTENWGIRGGIPASEIELGFKIDI